MPTDRRTWREWAAVILLPFGGFVFGLGWLVGVILLWSSRLWTTRDKLIGTLIVPGGIATAAYVALAIATKRKCIGFAGPLNTPDGSRLAHTTLRCTPSSGVGAATNLWHIALLLFVVVGPIVTAIYLARRARGRSAGRVASSV